MQSHGDLKEGLNNFLRGIKTKEKIKKSYIFFKEQKGHDKERWECSIQRELAYTKTKK